MYNRVLKHIKAKDLRETISLRFTDVLNPVFWIGDCLRPEVREALMRFAKAESLPGYLSDGRSMREVGFYEKTHFFCS